MIPLLKGINPEILYGDGFEDLKYLFNLLLIYKMHIFRTTTLFSAPFFLAMNFESVDSLSQNTNALAFQPQNISAGWLICMSSVCV